MTTLADVKTLSEADRHLGFVSTTRPDQSVHSSLVTAGFMDHPVTGIEVVSFVVFGTAHKLGFLRSSGRASMVFRADYRWAGIEGPVHVIGQDDAFAGFDNAGIPQLLRDVFTAAGGTHDDWDEFDRVMAVERRAAIFVVPERVFGQQ